MRMTTSLVFDETRLAPKQAVAHELDLAQPLGKSRQHLEQRQQRAIAQRSTSCARFGAKSAVDKSAMQPSPRAE